MLKHLKQSNLPVLLVVSLFIKSIYAPSPVFDGIGITALSILFGFKLWLDHIKKPDHNAILNKKVDENQVKTEKHIKELNDRISSIGANIALTQKKQQNNKFSW